MRAALITLALAACSQAEPTPTGTVCPDPDPGTLTYESFGQQFMTDYCVMCHDSKLTRPQRNGAPIYHDFDTLLGVLEVPDHIDEQAGSGPNAENTLMPPDRCPEQAGGPLAVSCKQPTAEERKQLAEWIACERERPHTF